MEEKKDTAKKKVPILRKVISKKKVYESTSETSSSSSDWSISTEGSYYEIEWDKDEDKQLPGN